MGTVQVRRCGGSIAYQSDMRVGGYDPQEHDHGELWPGTTESMGRQGKKAKQNAKRPAEKVSYSSSRKHRGGSGSATQATGASGGSNFDDMLVQKCDMCS